jgi:hypothetical protein
VRDIEGMIRAMGLTRVQYILQDLIVMEGEFWRIMTRYKTDHERQGGMPGMESMERVISISRFQNVICKSKRTSNKAN